MGYAFISYSTKNKESADAIKNLLNKNNIETWIAPNDIPAGSKYAEVISKAVKNCSCLVLLLTDNSQNSTWVSKEVERAINYKKVIIPVQLEDVILNDEFEMYISTDQILPVKKIDDSSPEMSTLLNVVKVHTEFIAPTGVSQIKTLDNIQQLDAGTIIDGKYKIIRKLGQGGYCEVFLAVNEKTNKYWAIKAIRKAAANYNEFSRNLSGEVSILNGLDYPGIPAIIDIIDTNKYLLIIMDYIEGNSFDKVVSELGAQTEPDVIRWAIQLCETLEYLHSQTPPIIHNDINPRNILLLKEGQIKLVDFGVSIRLGSNEQETTVLGTSGYAAPEKYTLGSIDQRTDIYSLGVTLYSLITGKSPSTLQYTMYPLREINPSISKGFEYVINKCIKFQPEDRYQTASELLFDLQHIEKITRDLSRSSLLRKIFSTFKNNNHNR